MNIPWWRWGPRSRSDWWRAPEICEGRLRPSEWWACSDQWSGLEAEIHNQLARQTHDTAEETVHTGQHAWWEQDVPGHGVASEESRSGWRPARECWPLDSYSRLSNVCQAEDWKEKERSNSYRVLTWKWWRALDPFCLIHQHFPSIVKSLL